MTRYSLPAPGRQIFIQSILDRVRQTSLHGALRIAARNVPNEVLRAEIASHVPAAGLQALQGTGVRDEEAFALPSILRLSPGLLGYYRLLLGVSQKGFYTTKTGLSLFRSMEESQVIRDAVNDDIEELCTALNASLSVLLISLPQGTLAEDIMQLPLLTLGAQADGSWRVQIGAKATTGVFDAMKRIVKGAGRDFVETDVSITMTNSAGREVTMALAPDPDIVIREQVNGQDVYKCAIEIKGGADYANLHNRVGEAEKSHQKARASGAQNCWTVISLDNADMSRLRQESPTTREWLDVNEVLDSRGSSWDTLNNLTLSAMGI